MGIEVEGVPLDGATHEELKSMIIVMSGKNQTLARKVSELLERLQTGEEPVKFRESTVALQEAHRKEVERLEEQVRLHADRADAFKDRLDTANRERVVLMLAMERILNFEES